MNASDRMMLLKLLDEAITEIMQLGAVPYLGKFGTCDGLGQYIAKLRTEIEEHNQPAFQNLWRIFAPTCDWDDAGGSAEIADSICEILTQNP